MAHKEYNKLVRDKIPAIIQAEGNECGVETIQEDYLYRLALLEKLVEEAKEALEVGKLVTTNAQEPAVKKTELVKELTDLSEVMEATMLAFGISLEKVREEQSYRKAVRGGFENRIRLLWVE